MKAFPFLLLLLTFYTTTYAQFERFTYGVRAGLSLANVFGDTFDDPLFRPGGYGGIYVTTDVDRDIDVSLEILYSQQGLRLEDVVERPGNTSTDLVKQENLTRLDYILIPIVGVYKPTERLKLKFGPQFGYLINSTTTDLVALFGDSINEREVAGLQELTKKFNFGLTAGFSIDVYEGLYFEARYNLGVTGIFKDDDNFFTDENSFNSVFHIGLGFDLK